MPAFIIHGDASPLENAESIETHDDLARHMFVTLQRGADRVVWIRAVAPKDLPNVIGPIYQLDKDDRQDALVLRQVEMKFWPRQVPATLDELLHAVFTDFHARLSGPGVSCFAKERDCVNWFAMGHLVPACVAGSPLYDPAQIGVEVAVGQPDGVGSKPTAPKDLVIWDRPFGACWSDQMKPIHAPLAVLEWKVERPGAANDGPAKDRSWVEGFTRDNPGRLGYSVMMEVGAGGVMRHMTVSRCVDGRWDDSWFAG